MHRREGRVPVILLVDDDPGDQELTRRALQNGPLRINLHIVSNGEEALNFLFHRAAYSDTASYPNPDLVLLDLNMPKVDGRQVLETVRKSPTLRGLPVVILTTSEQQEDVIRSYEMGANSYVAKPVELEAFTRFVKQLFAYWFGIVLIPSEKGRRKVHANDLRIDENSNCPPVAMPESASPQ